MTDINMPETSNVLQYFTEDGTKISVRPSGTEPKIKFYVEVKGEMGCPKCYDAANAAAEEKVEAVRKSLCRHRRGGRWHQVLRRFLRLRKRLQVRR